MIVNGPQTCYTALTTYSSPSQTNEVTASLAVSFRLNTVGYSSETEVSDHERPLYNAVASFSNNLHRLLLQFYLLHVLLITIY